MAFAQQCIDDKIMPLKKQKRIIGKYTYGLKGILFANINSVPDALYIIAMLLILALTFSALVAVGCAAVTDEKALIEWVGTTTEDFHAIFFHFILPAPFVFLGLLLIDIFVIRSIPVRREFIADAKEKIKKKATEERVLPNHIVDVPCKLKRFFAEIYVSENGAIRLWDESGNHKLFKKDFCGEAYEKEIEYFGTEVEANKFYNISDLITEKAEK